MGIGDTNLPDDFTHNYLPPVKTRSCALCDAYGDGYSAGKETGVLRGPQLASPAARALLRVQPVHHVARSVIEKARGADLL